MPRSLVLAISLAALLSGSGNALAHPNLTLASAAKAAQPFNIGFVLYEGKVPGTLDARWNVANAYSGRGIATGGPPPACSRAVSRPLFPKRANFLTRLISTSRSTPAATSTM